MAAEPRVTARDPVEVVGGKRWRRKREGDREKDSERSESEKTKREWGVSVSNLPGPPQGTSILAASSTKINHLHQRNSSDHSVRPLIRSKLTYAVIFTGFEKQTVRRASGIKKNPDTKLKMGSINNRRHVSFHEQNLFFMLLYNSSIMLLHGEAAL